MRFKNGCIFMKNKSETYGTLILFKKSLKINDKKIRLEIGKTIVESRQMRFGEFENLQLKNKINNLSKKD